MTRNSHTRNITNDFLDKRIQNMILPFRCMKHLFFESSFSVKHNIIRPHSLSYYVFSFVGTLVFIIFHSINYLNVEHFRYYSPFLINFSHINRLLLIISFFVFYFINVVQKEINFQIILKIQEAFRIVNFKNYWSNTIWNWIYILLEFTIFFFMAFVLTNVRNAFFFYSLIYFDLITSYGIRIMSLLRDGMIAWIFELEHYCKLSFDLEDVQHHFKLKKQFQAYTVLLEAFDIFKRLFQYSILFQAVSTFLQSLQFFEISIEYEKFCAMSSISLGVIPLQIATILWILRNLILIIMFSVNCEKFYMTVCDADATCSWLLKTILKSAVSKRLCKNVLRLNRASFYKMTACRMFTVDGRLPQEFIYLLLEYLVVLLQFALLLWARQN